jgi:Phage tail assembly chaperone protein
MAIYAYVENGLLKDYCDTLPANWRNVSNFSALYNQPEFLNNLGWYVINHPQYVYNPETHKLDNRQFIIDENGVTETWTIVPLPSPAYDTIYNEFISGLRTERTRLLTESDWTQLADVQLAKTQEWKNAWSLYRQTLRDLPDQYPYVEEQIYSSITWPTKPE